MGPTTPPTKQAEQLRQDGNSYFAKNKLSAAIDAYTEVHLIHFFIHLIFIYA